MIDYLVGIVKIMDLGAGSPFFSCVEYWYITTNLIN